MRNSEVEYNPEQVPLELKGLDEASLSESWGSHNTGLDTVTVNANYRDGRFIYPDDPGFQVGSPSVRFRIREIPYELKVALRERAIILPPTLVDKVTIEPDVGETEEFFTQRAMQHNVFKIVKFLQKGGNPVYLPKTPLMPDMTQLRQQAGQQ